jgi:RNA polymerase sigma factor (sigma-70 family)
MGGFKRRRALLNEELLVSIHGPVQTDDNVVELHGERETSAAPRSFDDLFLDQHDRLYRALYFITGSSADAEELMQDAFLKLWERWDRIHAIDDPVGCRFRVAMNGFRMRARRARVAARRVVHLEAARDPFDDIELRDDVRRMLLGLPPRQRAALVLTGDLRIQLGTGRPDPWHPADDRARARLARTSRAQGELRSPGCPT